MLVTLLGGTGFIGPYVVRSLLEAGHAPTVFHRGQHEPDFPPAVRHIHHPDASIPMLRFPAALLAPAPGVVIHMNPMGEADARAAAEAFSCARRIVWLSSGDVYRAFGALNNAEPAPLEPALLTEDSPLRSVPFLYRHKAATQEAIEFNYEKIFVERIAIDNSTPPGVVLRLPKVYGPGGNANLASVYRYRHRPHWRWTHGYVENVAAAIVLAALHPSAAGRIYNVGEPYTPTIAERLAALPESDIAPDLTSDLNFAHHIAYDTTRLRRELGYREPVSYEEGLRRTFEARYS